MIKTLLNVIYEEQYWIFLHWWGKSEETHTNSGWTLKLHIIWEIEPGTFSSGDVLKESHFSFVGKKKKKKSSRFHKPQTEPEPGTKTSFMSLCWTPSKTLISLSRNNGTEPLTLSGEFVWCSLSLADWKCSCWSSFPPFLRRQISSVQHKAEAATHAGLCFWSVIKIMSLWSFHRALPI